ncbi:nuclear factor NF-kappa-B p105 subunit-like isoform X1 [Diorhabda sublineata]|uniref:nuclear factor NF-kappa-B p105 subunit-like isoform X1 n=2 Tax=Diorhabda sublineata TaxID=1163346 RepID=UPI0024E186B5|nr:nuclear factor NF-kappa-B p105 subunit-like isoform X1 [Diorhabda sublineata]
MPAELNNSDYIFPLQKSYSMSYPLTPPSSSEDSPQSAYYVASPNSTFEYENYDYSSSVPYIIAKAGPVIDPNLIKMEQEQRASLHFIEQPTDRFRFRYKSEMAGTHGSLTGINSDKSRKPTYPTVEVKNCSGTVIVRCSIYQSNAVGKDFLPHAHRLIMKKGREEHDDPHDITVWPENGYRAVFQGMGIIHTAKKNIVTELLRKKVQLKKEFIARTEGKMRELTTKELAEIKGLAESESKSINLNIVCLRFDAFIKDNGILYPICDPIFSHSINNLKSALTGDLKIVRLDHVVSPAKGNKEVYILVERVTKKNIKIRFYEVDDEDNVVWEDWGKFNDLDVHHQYAIVFRTPKYRDENITAPVNVFIELVRPTDNARSEARSFRYIPNKHTVKPGQKRARYDYSYSSCESSNAGSDELPVVISNLHIEQNAQTDINSIGSIPSGLSEELVKAMKDINSDEFKRIFEECGPEYESLIFEIDSPQSAAPPTLPLRKKMSYESEFAIKMEVTRKERVMTSAAIEQLRNFIRTTHTPQDAIDILTHYFGEDKQTNPLHVSICQKDNESAILLLKMIAFYKMFHLLEKSNADKLTPLHLAVLCHNERMVSSLLLCKAKIATLDSDLNTSLHLAIKSKVCLEILEMLLRNNRECEKVEDFIDWENADGNTALMMAVEEKKLDIIKLLCRKKADVNKVHPKNGYVPLRLAIEKEYVNIVKFFLNLSNVNPLIKDFMNVSPLSAAISKTSCPEIVEAARDYVSTHNIVLEVKDEPEDESEDEVEMDVDSQSPNEFKDEVNVKVELPSLSPEELEILYTDIKIFTPQALDEVSEILDRSGNWRQIAHLLGIEHLIESGIIQSETSMSKAVLRYSTETSNDNIWIIRNFLENLDEHKTVEILDRMVRNMRQMC